jgi:hypothetical protein
VSCLRFINKNVHKEIFVFVIYLDEHFLEIRLLKENGRLIQAQLASYECVNQYKGKTERNVAGNKKKEHKEGRRKEVPLERKKSSSQETDGA